MELGGFDLKGLNPIKCFPVSNAKDTRRVDKRSGGESGGRGKNERTLPIGFILFCLLGSKGKVEKNEINR